MCLFVAGEDSDYKMEKHFRLSHHLSYIIEKEMQCLFNKHCKLHSIGSVLMRQKRCLVLHLTAGPIESIIILMFLFTTAEEILVKTALLKVDGSR